PHHGAALDRSGSCRPLRHGRLRALRAGGCGARRRPSADADPALGVRRIQIERLLRDFIIGPWRAVCVLGVTEILSWGALFYPPVLTVPLIAVDHGWSKSFAMGGFSVGLFVGGLVSRYVGALIDRFGGHIVMPLGSLVGAAGLAGLVSVQS